MLICNCTLGGTQACKNCSRYKEYFGEQKVDYIIRDWSREKVYIADIESLGKQMEVGLLIEYINEIIRQAIEHGGDSGGAYFSNKEDLESAMRELAQWLSLTDYVICEDYEGYLYYARPVRDEKGDEE